MYKRQGLLEAFSEPCEACAARGVIVHHEPVLRQNKANGLEETNSNGQSGQGKRDKRDRGNRDKNKQDGNKPDNRKEHIEVAKVVTAESANALSSVIGKIAASTVAAHEAAGEPSPIVLTPSSSNTDSKHASDDTEKLLESVLEALPEPKAPGQGRRKPRRASSAGSAPSGASE